MKDTQEVQEASEALQGDIYKQENKTETQEQKEDKLRPSPGRHQSSVQFFSMKRDSYITALPLSQSLSSGRLLSYYLSSPQMSKITVSTMAPLASKSTVVSSSQTHNSLGNSCLLLSKDQSLDPELPVAGDSEDYFLSLFGHSKKLTSHSGHAKDPHKHFSTILEEVGKSVSSSLGDVEIADVHVKGLFVKLINSSHDREAEIGNHVLQQNVKGQAVSRYRFLPNIVMQAGSTVTVWAAASKGKHRPPLDFLWKEQSTFRASPDCTTILCKPHGEAVAWYTPIHWKQVWEKLETDIEFNRCSVATSTSQRQMFLGTTSASDINKDKQDQAWEDTSKCDLKQVPFLKREKEMPPTLFPNRSPWCNSPSVPVHPYCSLISPHGRRTPTASRSAPLRRHQAPQADPASVSPTVLDECLWKESVTQTA
ncbi:lamin tail domain-containing protein 1 [Octodon degus]|uniref:Lamin tail domain-containing protein 1 n=1 Tax=Octodon degus TaxID=10160 RepID=A0A6P6ERQ3_OCTDE|nr:lamin tail domain-containing protein 1 [Octodon degus]XP_023574782.1 lamin tail domain-containing protein 1 [Octodon degus]